MGLRMKISIPWGFTEKIKFLLGGGVTKNQYIYIYIGRICLKRGGGLGQFADLRGGLAEKEGVISLRGGLIPQGTL